MLNKQPGRHARRRIAGDRGSYATLLLTALLWGSGCDSPAPPPNPLLLPTATPRTSHLLPTTARATPAPPTLLPATQTPALFALPQTLPTDEAPSPTPLAIPAAPYFRWVLSLAAADSTHAWALDGALCDNGLPCPLELFTTGAHGQDWQELLPSRDAQGQVGWIRDVGNIRFATAQDGWAYGPRLFTTHDGGQTWTDANRQGKIVALEPKGGTVWAIEQRCSQPDQCTFTLLVSKDVGRTWQVAAIQPPLPGPVVHLVRVNATDAWMLSEGIALAPDAQYASNLVTTHDGGNTWQKLPSPSCEPGISVKLAVVPPAQLWVLSGDEPGTGAQAKSLCMSPDGGQHWRNLNAPSMEGYIAGFAVSTPERAWVTMNRGLFYTTNDGGYTWQPVDSVIMDRTTAASGPVLFVDALHGWTSWYNQIYRTTDGGNTWK
jgi:photosystem II stability/assembly factor-like uncharacterized protein